MYEASLIPGLEFPRHISSILMLFSLGGTVVEWLFLLLVGGGERKRLRWGFIFIVTVIIKYKVLGNTNGWTREKGWCDCGATMNISTALSASIS